jgi:CheY-like chemotaxis protein
MTPPIVLRRYELLDKLGEGGMGVVYKARDRQLDRLVALKFLASGLAGSERAEARSVEEARTIAALNHANIATIYEIRETEGAPVLALEYLPGGTLRARLDSGRLPFAEIVEIGRQVADGLAHAHAHGVVHGDVKPENLLFTADGRVKITDFGIARSVNARTVTADGKIVGTMRYLPPECLRGAPADRRADVFALGVVLEEMAAGREVAQTFRQLIASATAREASCRPQSMADIAAVLRRLVVADNDANETPTILVVEDDEVLRSVLAMGLNDEGYRVIAAKDGREGIRLAAQEAPHLVLLDVRLPALNGFDVCRELRREGFNAPIMMVTGKTDEVDRVVGLEIGADDYLTKPFGHRELITRVRAHLRRAYTMDASRRFVPIR